MALPPITKRLERAKLVLDNALQNHRVQAALAEYGYGRDRLQEGLTLYQVAQQSIDAQRHTRAEQLKATETLQERRDKAHQSYMRLVKVARVTFQNSSDIAAQLAIIGPRKKDFLAWLDQADLFYQNTLKQPHILTALEIYGVTKAKITLAHAEWELVKQAWAVQIKLIRESQQATQVKDSAMLALDNWMADFIKIARIALEDSPQLLEVLGLKHSSSIHQPSISPDA